MLVPGVVNIVVSRVLYRVAHQEQSVALEADALHLKTDVYSSLGVAGGLLLIVLLTRVFNLPWATYLDPVVAIAIAALILFEAWGMLRKASARSSTRASHQMSLPQSGKRVAASPHGPALGAHPTGGERSTSTFIFSGTEGCA